MWLFLFVVHYISFQQSGKDYILDELCRFYNSQLLVEGFFFYWPLYLYINIYTYIISHYEIVDKHVTLRQLNHLTFDKLDLPETFE